MREAQRFLVGPPFVLAVVNMLTLRQIAEIAARHLTAMADAMLAACVEKALATGERLVLPERARPERGGKGEHPVGDLEDDQWRRMVEDNGDTRWQHV